MNSFDLFSLAMKRHSRDKDVPENKVAVLDTGLDAQHPYINTRWKRDELKDRGYVDFVSEDGKERVPKDEDGHGTHCAGLILRYAQRANLYVARITETNEPCRKDRDFNDKVAKVC